MGRSSRRRVAQPLRNKQGAKQREKIKRLQVASGIELKALPFAAPASLAQATQMIAAYRQRELDLLEFQQKQAHKMSSLRQKAEKTVGSLSQEIEMMSADLADQRTQLAQEIKLRRKEEKHRRTAEADAERLRRELRGERDELRLAVAKETQLQIERDRLDAVLSKVGAGALDDLEARLQSTSQRLSGSNAKLKEVVARFRALKEQNVKLKQKIDRFRTQVKQGNMLTLKPPTLNGYRGVFPRKGGPCRWSACWSPRAGR